MKAANFQGQNSFPYILHCVLVYEVNLTMSALELLKT